MENKAKYQTAIKACLLLMLTLFWFGAKSFAQTYAIKGTVIESTGRITLPGASLFIGNTTLGTITDKDGHYEFTGLSAGKYQLIITYVGYQNLQATVDITDADIVLNINLKAKTTVLREVTINPKDRINNLNLFKRDFIGTTDESECKIVNPDVLNFDTKNKHMVVTADDLLEIENSNLGYKLRFLITDYDADYNTGKVHYAGTVIYTNLTGSKSKMKTWAKHRDDAYSGSFRHFLTSAGADQLAKDKFEVHILIRKPNTKRPPDSLISAQLAKFMNRPGKAENDSLYKWNRLLSLKKDIEYLDRTLITVGTFAYPSKTEGIFNLKFNGSLYVIYKGKHIASDEEQLFRPAEAKRFQTSAVSIINNDKPVSFNKAGILNIKDNIFYEGAWTGRILNTLPDDYVPIK